MRAFAAAVVFGAGIAACSSDDSAANGGATDAGNAGDDASSVKPSDAGNESSADASGSVSGDSSVRATACTAAPYVAYGATITKLAANGASTALAGVQIGFSTCEGFELTTDANGQATTQLTQSIAVTPFYTGPGTISAIGAEIPATGDVTQTIALFDGPLATLVPGFTPDSGASVAILGITLVVDAAATAPCDTTSDVTLSVTGHAEASVSYMGASWPTSASVASTTASTDGDRAFIGGITGATKVQLAGTKSGCSVKLVTGSQTGNFALVPGAITLGVATITN